LLQPDGIEKGCENPEKQNQNEECERVMGHQHASVLVFVIKVT
jgi:hypothetical protein